MVSRFLFVCLALATASATSPLIDEVAPEATATASADTTATATARATGAPVATVPRKCPQNEVLRARFACPPDTCDTLYLSFLCIANQTETVMCTCKDGYLRTNSTGVCVPTDRCLPPECANDPNAKRGCGNRCKKTCADYNNSTKVCSQLNACNLFGCECKDGFVYDENTQKCVKPKECTKQCTKPNERYSSCVLGECVAKTCEDLGKPIACPGIASPCTGGCICKEGFVRNSNGDCIETSKCPSCGGDPNAQSGCGNPCGKTCADRSANKSDLVCPQYCEVNGCDCKPGYLLNTDTKKCVLAAECPEVGCEGDPNAEKGCAGYCTQTCNKIVKNPRIECVHACIPGCQCKSGFLYNPDTKRCVPKDKCPAPGCGGDPNAQSGCGSNCGKTCADKGKAPVACTLACRVGGCDCKPGYLLDTNTNKCVPEGQCPNTGCGGDLNAQSGCGNPCGKTCAEKGKRPSACPQYCKVGGCDCKPGYLLDTDTNKCVPEGQCPKNTTAQCTGPHEKYISCPAGQCNPKTCDNLINPAPCPRIIPPCPGGCICEDGYLRDANGICIEQKKCPQASCSANETYVNCAVKCPDAYCPENDQPQPVCDPPRNCAPGCRCKINYRLNKNGKCILASECPAIKCTRQNEEYNSCPSDCLSENCEDADSPPAVCNTLLLNCQPKCICKKNHYRNKDGLCVPATECPSVCKDPNAQWKDCKDPCPGTCQNTKPACTSKICTAGCQCKDGYVLSEPGGKCVKIDTCADYANCGANQTFVSCTFKCPQVMCPESDETILCKPPRDCPGGCGCKDNYRYNADGECILGSDCPPVECTRPNEEWSPCRSVDDWEKCEDRYNSPPFVPSNDPCNPRCTCIKGYYRDPSSNECVPESACPPISKK